MILPRDGSTSITGYTGMWLAVRANVRTANAAKESGLRRALRIAFRAGGVAGMFTVGLGLFGATLILLIYEGDATSVRSSPSSANVTKPGLWRSSASPRMLAIVTGRGGSKGVKRASTR